MGKERMQIKLSDLPASSSLGMLAEGDIVFEAWRKIKQTQNIDSKEINEEE